MKPSHLFAAILVVAILPASAWAFRPGPADQLVQSAQQRALRRGDSGEQVAELQRLLDSRGFDPGQADGRFGPQTERAVLAAQRHYALPEDGLAGRLTVGALRNETSPVPPPSAQTPTIQTAAAQPPTVPEKTGLVVYQAGGGRRAAVADPVTVALTFNGLPEPGLLDALLASLAARSMHATFFVTGEQAEAHRDLVERIHRAGHEVGSLGFGEIDMRKVSPMTAAALLRRTGRAIEAATGTRPSYFRPPLGLFDRNLTTLVVEEGMRMVLWSNVAVLPVPEVGADRLVQQLTDSLFPHMVIMLPLERPYVISAVAPLLERMSAAGYKSEKLSNLLPPPSESQPVPSRSS